MSQGFPKYGAASRKGDYGVDLVSQIIHRKFGWIFKRTHQEHDFGVDALVDIVLEDGTVTGQMLALQIKFGNFYFKEKNNWGYIYSGKAKHLNYLSNYPVPVLIVICDPSSNECYWVKFDLKETSRAGENWKMTLPFKNLLSRSKPDIEKILPPCDDYLPALESYWSMNQLIADSGYIHFIIDKLQIEALDVTEPRAFFDRLQVTKELAFKSQGKVEISFHGYEDDDRELFEIDEVRQYIKKLDEVLKELFFFVRTGKSSYTIRTFAYCLTNVDVLERNSETKRIHLEFDTQNVADFLTRHWPALNETTEWLSMNIEENKRISFAVMETLGIDTSNFDSEPA